MGKKKKLQKNKKQPRNYKCIYYVGDIGEYSSYFKKILNIINQEISSDDIMIALGDNFYPSGIISTTDKQLNNFKETFKKFKNKCYFILGNHDYLINPKAQIDYIHEKWCMPSWYYNISFDDLELIFLDTITLAPNDSPNFTKEHVEYIHSTTCSELQNEQIQWLENILIKNKHKKIIVHGHYPLYTNGDYSDCTELRNILIPFFKKYKINLYICGHEHNVQFLTREIENYDINMVICGSSSYSRKTEKNTEFINGQTCFIRLKKLNNLLEFHYINHLNKIIYKKMVEF